MEQTTYASRLRYLDAGDLDSSAVDFKGLEVRATDGTRLGEVDGFLVDPQSRRVLYTIVDAGGWFTSRRILVPIGHSTVDRDGRALDVDLPRERLRNYPEFDERRFRELSDDQLRVYEQRMTAACCPDEVGDAHSWSHDVARHFLQPAWWAGHVYSAERLRPVEPRPFRSRPAPAPPTGVPARDTFDHAPVIARGKEQPDDVSPHFGGRAQPGDVLGLETGGERTHVGETADDENERRRQAERAVADEDEPRDR